MAPTWTPEVAKVANSRCSGIEIAETHFSRKSLEKRRLQAQRRCPNRLQGGIGEDKGRPKCSQRHPSASTCCKSYAFVLEWYQFHKMALCGCYHSHTKPQFYQKRLTRRHEDLCSGAGVKHHFSKKTAILCGSGTIFSKCR